MVATSGGVLMRVWILLFSILLLTGCYDKTTCCLVDGGCDAATGENGDGDVADGDGDAAAHTKSSAR